MESSIRDRRFSFGNLNEAIIKRTMNPSRRHFIEKLSTLSAGALLIGSGPPWTERLRAGEKSTLAVGNALQIPPLFPGGDFVAGIVETNIWPDRPSSVWTYGGSYPAPTIRIRRGDQFTARLINQLPEPTNIHWHGLLVPADMDGHPMDMVEPGASRSFAFHAEQAGGTFWYHPHVHGSTAKQVFLGMAGLFIIEDEDEEGIGLPSGEFDIPLLLQDKRENPERTITYEPEMQDLMTGMIGGTMLANGTPDAYLDVSRDLYRFRILNASNGRIMKLALDDGSPFHLIANDGGLLDQPYPVDMLWLGPAERVEILIDFSSRTEGSSVTLLTLPFDEAPEETWQGWGMDIVRFDITGPPKTTSTIPLAMRPIQLLTESQAIQSRGMQLSMIHAHPDMFHLINGEVYDMNRIDERVEAGSIEMWQFINVSDEPHPMHIHGAQFQILERGRELDAKDKGWKDTVIVDLFEQMKVMVKFADHPGLFVAHCHNLEHSETGMMINVEIDDDSTDVGIDGVEGIELDLN